MAFGYPDDCLIGDPWCGAEHSPYWAYNQPGWQPRCDRCGKRGPAKKYNAKPEEDKAGRFAGRWICAPCVTPDDTPTPYQKFEDEYTIRLQQEWEARQKR